METRYALPDRVSPSLQLPALPNLLAYVVAAAFVLYQVAVSYELAILSPVELVWNGLVDITPTRLLLGAVKRSELRQKSSTWSQTHAAKSEAMRSLLGLGSGALLQQLPAAGSNIVRRLSLAPSKVQSDAPPGLGNWDNSCYQNSVLQGLSAVEALKPYLATIAGVDMQSTDSTSAALQETVGKLNGGSQNGRHFWTPAKLKSMSSWQQQDAQEYYSKIVDELEKEGVKAFSSSRTKAGLETVTEDGASKGEQTPHTGPINPLEGLLAQRVSCTRCNASDGLSMIPFNCLTVPLGAEPSYDLSNCLSEYTALEEITDVDCTKCTLLKAKAELGRRLRQAEPSAEPTSPDIKALLDLPSALRVAMAERLAAINEALDTDDFSDKTLTKTCQISKANRVSSTKTRQAVIGRPPKGLVVHVQRSVFDEMTGAQRKNYAAVRYPEVLDLGPWVVGYGKEDGTEGGRALSDASISMLAGERREGGCLYRLKAVVTHYGRHENGHYIAYRQHRSVAPNSDADDATATETHEVEDDEAPWWRLSDEDVSTVSRDDVLGQGGVFMLFYERIPSPEGREEMLLLAPAIADGTAEPIAASQSTRVDESLVQAGKPEAEDASGLPASQDDGLALATSTPLPTDEQQVGTSQDYDHDCSTGATTEDESEADVDDAPALGPVQPVPQLRMRTARIEERKDGGFGTRQRFVEAS